MGIKSTKYSSKDIVNTTNVNGTNHAKYKNLTDIDGNKNADDNGFKSYSPKDTIFSTINCYYKNLTNSNSSLNLNIKNDENLKLTSNEIRIIQLTWNFIKEDIHKVGVMIFMRSFESLPEMKNAFEAFRTMNSEDLIKSHTLRTHSRKVMNIVESFVENIEKTDGKFKKDVVELGKRHYIYGATNEFLYIMEKQFIDSIRPIIQRQLNAMSSLHSSVETEEPPVNSLVVKPGPLQDQNLEDVTKDEQQHELLLSELKDLLVQHETNTEKLKFIDIIWHKAFAIIKKYMNDGINETRKKVEKKKTNIMKQ